jgi:hypothetical protein
MRFLRALILSAAALCFGAHAAAQSGPAGDADVARPGGVYNLLTAPNASACAQACTDDGICMAWTFQAGGACELKAVAPAPVRAMGARSGLSSRTPPGLRQADANALRALTPIIAEAPPPPAANPQLAAITTLDDSGLLGGLEDDAPETLRPRLGSAGTW